MSSTEIRKLQEIYEMGFIGVSEYHERMAQLVGPSYSPSSEQGATTTAAPDEPHASYLSSSSGSFDLYGGSSIGSFDIMSSGATTSYYEPPLPSTEPPPLQYHDYEPPLPTSAPPPLLHDPYDPYDTTRSAGFSEHSFSAPQLPPAPPPAVYSASSIVQMHPSSAALIRSLVQRYRESQRTDQCPQCLVETPVIDHEWGLCDIVRSLTHSPRSNERVY